MSSTDSALRVRWPYKQLWNLLRGESILADDEVILEELTLSYEHIIQALTQYKAPKAEETQTTAKGPTEAKQDTNEPEDAEDKIRQRISKYLELEESVAWELFCSYMMFEYKGVSTSFDKLLETPRATNELLTDLKLYYSQERKGILLCLQALLGNLNDLDHKYHHIFEAFKTWADKNGSVDLTLNLLKSLDLAQCESEEIEILHVLAILTFQMPHLTVHAFLKGFKGFKSRYKTDKMLMAEATVMYSVLLVSGFPSPEFPDEFKEGIQDFLLENATELLSNKYAMGAVMGGFVSACQDNPEVQRLLTTSPHSSTLCVPSMIVVAQAYSETGILNRHNLSEIVLKGVYDATKAIYENLDSAIPHFGSKNSYFEFLILVLRHKAIAKRFLCDKPDLMNLYTDAMVIFPLELRWILGMWGSICGTVDSPEEAATMLEELTALLSTISEYSSDPALAYPRLQNHNSSSYKNPRDRVVAGVLVPAGSDIAYLFPHEDTDTYIVAWDLKTRLPISPWEIVLNEILMPAIYRLKDLARGSIIEEDGKIWFQREGENNNIQSLLKFLTTFATVSSSIPIELNDLYEPMAHIMLSTADLIRSMSDKAVLVANLLQLITTANRFGEQSWTHRYLSGIWPGGRLESTNLVEEIIMGFESVAQNDCNLTLSFLKSILGFFKESDGGIILRNPMLHCTVDQSIIFVTDNVFHSFTRWRMESEEVKYNVLVHCLKVYNALFGVQEDCWNSLKEYCAKVLFRANSSLMAVLSVDENLLQLSVLEPDKSVHLLPEVIYESLSLLLKLFQYQKESIRLVDASLGLTLVKKLGRFARHRLDYKIPTLAMSLLKKIAEELNMSLLSCFGNDEVAFRDLILQRLEFRSEDVNLKVAFLEFLTVAADTQPGLIQYVFMEEILAEKIVDLPLEKDEGLSLSVLLFLRALFRKRATVMKKCKNLWKSVFSPIKLLRMGGRVKIITCTLHILTIELFYCGLTETMFAHELKDILDEDFFLKIAKIALSDKTDVGVKCLMAMKHFLTVVISRNDLVDSFPESTKKPLLDMISLSFWEEKEKGVSNNKLATPMAELMCLLSSSIGEYPEYLRTMSAMLTTEFFGDCVAVQVSLLSLTNNCLKKASSLVPLEVVENIVRVVSRVFVNAAKVFEHANLVQVHPILRIAAVITCTIINSEHCSGWEKSFDQYLLSGLIVSVANLGITTGKGPEIVSECLHVMTSMAEEKKASKMLQYSELGLKVWSPVSKFANLEIPDPEWDQVYILSINLMTKLLQQQSHFFLEECFNFWVIHGMYIAHKLWSLSEMTKYCIMNRPEHNYTMMFNLLNFNIFVLDAVAAMIPYYDEWKIRQNNEHGRIIEGVFTALKTSVSLLNQPHYLQVLISFATAQPTHVELRPTPHLVELQSKLWEVMLGSCHIYWKMKGHSTEFVKSEEMLATVHLVAQACIKSLTKGDKKSEFSVPNSVAKISWTLERALCIFHLHGQLVIKDQSRSTKQQQNFKREITSDIFTLCDSIRRVSKNDFLTAMCDSLESSFK